MKFIWLISLALLCSGDCGWRAFTAHHSLITPSAATDWYSARNHLQAAAPKIGDTQALAFFWTNTICVQFLLAPKFSTVIIKGDARAPLFSCSCKTSLSSPIAQMEGTNEIPSIPLKTALHACMFWAIVLGLPVSMTASDADCERFSRRRTTGP